MSVINNVLKDLENKPSAFKPLNLNAVNHEHKHKLPVRAIWLLVPLLIAALAAVYYIQRFSPVEASIVATADVHPSPQNIIISTQAEPPVTSLAPSILTPIEESAAARSSNQLVGLHINETPTFVELSFQLTESAQSSLKQRTQNRYVFMIRNSVSEISAPLIENPWLKDIQLTQNQQNVEIQFYTADDVLVETLHEQQQQDHYWKIRLKKSISAEKSEVISSSSEPVQQVKQPTVATSNPAADNTTTQLVKTDQATQSSNVVKLEIKPAKIELTDSERLKRAINQFEAGEWSAAEIGLKSLQNSELDRESRINLLSLYQYRQKPQQFRQLLTESLAQYPQDMDFILIDANQLINSKQYSTLVQRYKDNSQDKQLLSLVAASYQRLQQHNMAIDYYTKALELDPRQPKNWISLAISQEQQAEYTQALQSYQMAMRSGSLNNRLTGFVQQRIQQLNNGAL